MYKKYKPVKEYFDFYINPDEQLLLSNYKDKVYEGFFPSRGWKLKLSISRKAINDFKKLGPSPDSLADLLLYFVECGVMFTDEYGDIDENFYSSVENTYFNALELMKKKSILGKFKNRSEKIVTDTSGIGWGFHDTLGEIFDEFYDDE